MTSTSNELPTHPNSIVPFANEGENIQGVIPGWGKSKSSESETEDIQKECRNSRSIERHRHRHEIRTNEQIWTASMWSRQQKSLAYRTAKRQMKKNRQWTHKVVAEPERWSQQ
jgi:hypothetical protein